MNPTPNQKNIVHGSITAGGNVIIGDTTYINNYFAAQEVKIPHRLTNNISTNADHILGRATELAQAKDHLAQHQATVFFNGIGKTSSTPLKIVSIFKLKLKQTCQISSGGLLGMIDVFSALFLKCPLINTISRYFSNLVRLY